MSDNPERLRAEAEAQISGFEPGRAVRPADGLLHDLQVHRIELEMQNDTLRQTQIALEESRDRYRDLYDFAPAGYLTLNEHGIIIEINHTAAGMLGVARNKLINHRFAQYLFDEDGDLWRNCFLAILKNKSTQVFEQRLKGEDAQPIFSHLACQYVESSNCVRITLTDITSRRQAEMRLRESEEKFRAIFAGTLDGIVLIDGTGLIVDCNPEFMRQTGMTLDRLKQTRLWELRPADKAELAKDVFLKVMKTGSGGAADFKYKQPDGKVIHVNVRGTTIHIGGKRFLQCISHDITERLRSEMLLRDSEEKRHVIFESALDGILLLNVETRQFSSANPALCSMLGYSADEIGRLGVADVHPPEDLPWISEAIQRHVSGETQLSTDIPMKRRDGSVFYADIRSSPVTLGGKVYLVGVFHDTSERKRTENELRAYQQLLRDLAEQRSALREAQLKHIAREVHDELGQLLTALRMDISLLRIQFGEHDPVLMEKIQDMLVLVDKSILGVRHVSTKLHPPALDMGIASALEWLRDEFASRTSIACTLQIANDSVDLDDARTLTMFRIVQESLTNIARHAEATQVAIGVVSCGDDICVEVHDDGKGFDMGSMPAGKSFGLMGMRERALAVCGKVEVTSALGEGTVVSVRIPLFQTNPGRRCND